MHLRPLPLPVIVHHLLRHIFLVANRRSSTRLTVRAAASAHSASAINVVGTRATSPVASNRLIDDLLFDFGIGLRGLLRLSRRDSECERQHSETNQPFHETPTKV